MRKKFQNTAEYTQTKQRSSRSLRRILLTVAVLLVLLGLGATFAYSLQSVPLSQDIPAQNGDMSESQPFESSDMDPFSFGDLSMDMTQEQVLALLGEPEQISEEESPRWFYPTLVIRFHSFDQTASSISSLTGCELALASGIRLGSTEEQVETAYPEVHIDPNYNENNADTCYQVSRGSQTLLIGTAGGQVVYISLHCHADPMLNALRSDSITIYTPVDAGHSWKSTVVTGKAAKTICTVLTISEPEEPSEEKTDFICWLDLGNGTALNLYGNDTAAIYTYNGEALDPSRTDGLVWHLSGCFPDLNYYVTRAMEETSSDEDHPLQGVFSQLNMDTLTDYTDKHPESWNGDWNTLYINEAGLDDHGTDIYTTQGDQVLALDAENSILLIRVQGEDYQGVLAIANGPEKLNLHTSSLLGTSGDYVGNIAETHNGILAINAGPLDPDDNGNGAALYGYTMCNGVEYNSDNHLEDGLARLEINAEGTFTLTDTQAPVSDDTHNAVEAPFALIKDGVIVADETISGLHPRACIGQTKTGEVLMLVIEGRLHEYSLGADLLTCAEILQQYGCINALNLQQGTSAILWFDGEYVTRCSNQALPGGRLLPAAFVMERSIR